VEGVATLEAIITRHQSTNHFQIDLNNDEGSKVNMQMSPASYHTELVCEVQSITTTLGFLSLNARLIVMLENPRVVDIGCIIRLTVRIPNQTRQLFRDLTSGVEKARQALEAIVHTQIVTDADLLSLHFTSAQISCLLQGEWQEMVS
jgi:hypothetical protein